MKYLLPLLVLLAVNHVHANLGETILQIEARYGKSAEQLANPTPTSKPQEAFTFHYTNGDYTVAVTFSGGNSRCEEYTRRDGKDLTNDEIQKILDGDNQKSQWGEIYSSGSIRMYPIREWGLNNKDASAIYDSKTKTLTVETGEVKRAADAKAAEEIKRLSSP